jgi:hypothetical protein
MRKQTMLQSIGRKYYQVLPDHIGAPDQWFLDDPRDPDGIEIDSREFMRGQPYQGRRPATVPVFQPGRELAFNFASIDMPVVSDAVKNAILQVAPTDVDFYSVAVLGSSNKYNILNAKCSLDCLDEARSEITRWEAGDNQPDRIGQIHVVSTIRVDPLRANDRHVFRLKVWRIALLVSETIVDAIKDIPNLGVVFKLAS